jgi:hypothetical protein
VIASHIIPKFYLEQFSIKMTAAAETGHIWVYTKGRPARRGTAKTEGRECGYFRMQLPSGEFDESLEYELAKYESRCDGTLREASDSGFIWTPQSRQNMAFYIALLKARNVAGLGSYEHTSRRSQQALLNAAQDPEFVGELANRYSVRMGGKVSEELVVASIQRVAASLAEGTQIKQDFLEQVLFQAAVFSHFLLQKKWQIWTAPEEIEFITSDNPLLTVLPARGKFLPGWGLRNVGVLAMFPLCPSACLVMGSELEESYRKAQVEEVEEVNRCLVATLARNAYSRSLSPKVDDLVQTTGGAVKAGENAFLMLGDLTPLVKEFLLDRLSLNPGISVPASVE